MSREDAINDLYATIKEKFEEDGVLQEVRSMLQSKMVAMINGSGGGESVFRRRLKEKDERLPMLLQLISEYFMWHGFQYTSEMFAMECGGGESSQPIREYAESLIGPFEHKNLPILVELVAELMEKKKQST